VDSKIRAGQKRILNVFSQEARDFALSGGTALELYYLRHRFSADLDFFSPRYNLSEIELLVRAFKKHLRQEMRLESELMAGGKAKVRFYTTPARGSTRPLKIDFVEDVLFKRPAIQRAEGVRVYSADNIYLQKIAAVSGTQTLIDDVGREITEGRREARDAFDLYMLSRKIHPLHLFLRRAPLLWQKGIVHWYRTFSRQELKLGLMEMDIYDPQFNSGEMIRYLEGEIKQFAQSVIGAP
jgi:predicted nucleotidyltransferase component of viral defense system